MGDPMSDLAQSGAPDDGGTAIGDLASGGGGGGGSGLTANQKAVAEAMTSIWENDTPLLDYAYSENIHDGRGYTSGRAGFCTGTGDAIQVVDCYDKLRTAANGNLMAKYMPALTTINDQYMQTGMDQGDTSLLDAVGNWVNDWGASDTTTATQVDFENYRDVQGIKFPFKWTSTWTDGRTLYEIKNIQINPAIDAARFARPAPPKPPAPAR